MRFLKAHGLGNDYLVLEDGAALDPATVRAICHRHTGLGSDGILEPFSTDRADHGVRIWNPDGSVAEKSGNGLRIFARWLVDARNADDRFSLWTGSCRVEAVVHEEDVTVEMGTARVHAHVVGLDDATLACSVVDLGNPHCVHFSDTPVDALPWRDWGARIEVHADFPARTNVQFVNLLADGPHLRIWERGAGETSASGSSSCAVVAAAVATGRLPAGEHEVHMPGGVLHVGVDDALGVVLRGPVEGVGRMEWFG